MRDVQELTNFFEQRVPASGRVAPAPGDALGASLGAT
ncbi:hypothetical protein FHR38_002435 [Micromonospora polyrhachis]|uniref:Uncharacterized protein n=1 Tax=Micromonospora polyrhachis TaxID=1282883 RepID=A0A7W7SPR8_9ACTN|nr:hypothetical protein [Micromonospora polyrhachis]